MRNAYGFQGLWLTQFSEKQKDSRTCLWTCKFRWVHIWVCKRSNLFLIGKKTVSSQ